MSASLVGSEMCIRDRYLEATLRLTAALRKMRSKGARSFVIAGDFNLQMPPDQYYFGPSAW
eukprot:3882283-Alexandrium_andersonii.AAC.1